MIWFKRLIITLVVVIVVLVAAAVVVALTVDPNDYKDVIAQEVHEATGRTLRLEGDIELSFFPWLGLELGAATLSDAPGFGDQAFASIQDAQLRVAVLPLFKGEVRVDTLRLTGMEVNVVRDRNGRTNWEDLLGPEKEKGQPAAPEKGAGRTPLLAVGGIRVEDAAVHWQDRQTGTDLLIKPIDLSTGEIRFGKPFELDLQLTARNKAPEVAATLTVEAMLTLDPQTQRYRAQDLQLHLKAQGAELPRGEMSATLRSNVDADLNAGTLSLQPISLQTLSLSLTGEARVTQLTDGPRVKLSLHSDEFSPRELLSALGQPVPRTADEAVLTQAMFKVTVDADQNHAQLTDLLARLDDSTLTGELSVQSFQAPRIRFKADLDQIDVDRYLPPPSEPQVTAEGSPPKEGPAQTAPGRLELPTEALRKLDFDGTLTVGTLKVANLRMSQTQVSIKARDGLLQIDPAQTRLYEGQLHSRLALDVRKSRPRMSAAADLAKVQIGDLMQDLQQDKAYLEGLANLSFELNTGGDSVPALKKALNGNAALSVTDGALRDPELARKVEAVVAFLQHREPQPPGEALIFQSLSATAQISDGVAHNRDLKLLTPLIVAKGEGDIDIGDGRVDYTLKVALASTKEGKKQHFVPITIEGPFDELHYGLDLKGVAKERLQKELDKGQEKLQKKLEKKGGKLQEKLEEQLKGKLKLF